MSWLKDGGSYFSRILLVMKKELVLKLNEQASCL